MYICICIYMFIYISGDLTGGSVSAPVTVYTDSEENNFGESLSRIDAVFNKSIKSIKLGVKL